MIDFLDKEVFAVERNWAGKENISEYYSAEAHSKNILTVYENDKYYGYVCSKSFFQYLSSQSKNDEGYIIREIYVHLPDDEIIWESLHTMFLRSSVPYIPIFDQENHLLYFAYEDFNEIKDGMKNILESIKNSVGVLNIEGVKGVRIYHLNELGFLCWKLFQPHREVQVETIGDQWKVLFPQSDTILCDIPEYDVLEYYPRINPQKFFFRREEVTLSRVRSCVLMSIVEDYIKKMKMKGIKILKAYFSSPIKRITIDEEFRQIKAINPCMSKSKWDVSLIQEQICKVTGEEISYEEWCRENEKKRWSYIKIDGRLIFNKIFGKDEADKIYIIGPCIVEGEHVRRFEESLGGCIWSRLNEQGYPYAVSCIGLDMNDIAYYKMVFEYLSITDNDIILLVLPLDAGQLGDSKSDIPVLEIMKQRTGDWFWDCPVHTIYAGNLALAKGIVDDYLLPLCKKREEKPNYLQIGKNFWGSAELDALKKYIQSVRSVRFISENNHVGAIVMNCNPMTMGHRYLIE